MEIAAAEAREKARELHQERVFKAAWEESRRLSFEEGLRKGRIDQERVLMLERGVGRPAAQPRPSRHRPHSARVDVELQGDPLDPLNDLSSPTHPLQNFDDYLPRTSKRTPPTVSKEEPSLPGIEIRSPTPPGPTSSQNSPVQSLDHSLTFKSRPRCPTCI